ncbi:MAG: hypothetical protein WA056_01930 [Gallionella sp.]
MANNKLKYWRVGAQRRDELRHEWNRPVSWPLWLGAASLLLFGSARRCAEGLTGNGGACVLLTVNSRSKLTVYRTISTPKLAYYSNVASGFGMIGNNMIFIGIIILDVFWSSDYYSE